MAIKVWTAEELEVLAPLEPWLRAEKARRELGAFGRHVFDFPIARHHEVWLEALQDEEVKRLLIIAPPESMKSSWISLAYASWYIGRNPWENVILVSATATQAETWGVAVRTVIEENERFREVWPDIVPNPRMGWGEQEFFIKVEEPVVSRPWLEGKRLSKDNPHPTMASVGIKGPIVGKRAGLLIVDDPHNEINVSTRHQREGVLDFLSKSVKSRLKPDAKWIIVLTRWHQHDVADYFMQHENFLVLKVEALDGNQNSYWPEHWPREKLLDRRGETVRSKRIFEIMWQGNPTPEEGHAFRHEWFKKMEVMPRPLFLIQTWDTAFKKEGEVDFQVCETLGWTDEGHITVEHIWREQTEFPALKRKAMALYQAYGPMAVLIEDRASGQNLIQVLRSETDLPIIPVHPGKRAKEVRAEIPASYYEAGKVLHPKSAPWLEDFEDELLAFPYGRYDDQVDALSQGVEWLIERARNKAWTGVF